MKIKKIIILIILLFTIGCSKNEFNKDSFIDRAKFNGYIIENDLSKYKGYDYIKDVWYAYNREGMYFIQFLEIVSDDYAKRFFDLNMEDMIKLRDSDSYVKTINLSNYNVYHLETDSDYLLIIRSKNNIIYINAPINYINEIEEFLSELEIDF